ncbi:MAG: penicillin-binding protein 2, penicillin-binding protein 2 [Candidatus Nomurabacteria bacterium]|nr:penicillin-binding protein 2, penicillin-binding protein 2 [Candidatus Nomurabacteria bacterium]
MNLFRRTFTRRARRANSYEIAPEDVFLDSQNLSQLNMDQMEGQLEKPIGRNMFYITSIIASFLIVGFLARLYDMQIVNGRAYADQADRNHLKSTPLFPLRGTISDRNGSLLAWNTVSSTTEEVPERVYEKTPGFSHLLGYVSYPKKDQSGIFWQDSYLGKDGIEKKYQDILQGTIGETVLAVNAQQKVEARNVTVSPVNGENIKLSIDKGVQAEFYKNIKSLALDSGYIAGAGVIMDIHTGEVLAMVSYPEYDNNLITNAATPQEKDQLAKDLLDKNNKFLNRAVGGLFTPGSTVKPFMAIAALMENVITPEKQIYSSGALVIKNKYGGPDSVFKDWKAHGWTDMRKALAESSDEYFYQVGGGYMDQPGLGIARIDQYAQLFGFATTTGIDLPGEEYGVIPTPSWKQKIFNEDWLLGDTYHTSIGQYGFQITPLELVRGVAMIANGGSLVTPHLLSGSETVHIDLKLDKADLEVVREGMRQGVTEGIGAALNIDGIHVASKSGTAELGVKKDLVNSWISGFFPYENPKYAFVVIMEKGSVHNLHGAIFAMRDTLLWMRDNTSYTK